MKYVPILFSIVYLFLFMFIKVFSRFTTTKFPYNFKGVVVDQSTDVSRFAKKFFGENIDEGFLPAY